MEPSLAPRQLCALAADAATVTSVAGAVSPPGGRTPDGSGRHETVRCDPGQLYRCFDADVVACQENAVVGTCTRGCFSPGASVDDGEPVSREAAFAILCSR
jgi:hypothetical protein